MKRIFISSAALCLILNPVAFCASPTTAPTTAPTTQPLAGTFEYYQTQGTALQKQFKVLAPTMTRWLTATINGRLLRQRRFRF